MRNLICRLVLVFGVFALFAGSAWAWPTQAVTIIVPFPPGGTTDVLARLVGQKLSEAWLC
jgi:tripartite-type tricarboxylate transporter receptor subunit TctC